MARWLIYGQEALSAQTWALCTMNMFLHGVDDSAGLAGAITLTNPQRC
ncbi:MAG: N-6 DNA methylase [Lachnospiraceae bacterium]